MANPLSSDALSKIFKKSSRNPDLIGTNEGICVEYKESFGWKSLIKNLFPGLKQNLEMRYAGLMKHFICPSDSFKCTR